MEEKKPLVYRINISSGDTESSRGRQFRQMLESNLKAFGAQSTAMHDEISKWTSIIPGLVNPVIEQAKSAIYLSPNTVEAVEALAAWQERERRHRELLENSIFSEKSLKRSEEANAILGIDWDKPETAEPYNDLPVSQVWAIADEIKRTDRAIKEGRLTDTAVVRYLQKRGAVQVATANEPPHPDSHGWDAVFDWYYRAPRYLCDGMEDLSRRIGYTHGYVRQKHMLYKDQYGERPIPR